MTRRRGFTILELLVVCGIIALLVSLLLPALNKVREQAKSTACKSQLQNIGAAIRIYLNENKDRYPLAPTLPSVNPNHYPLLTDYLASSVSNVMDVFHCPGDETVFPVEKTSFFYYNELGERRIAETFFYRILGSVNKVPILWDAANFHGGTVPFNWLFADGHVDQFIQQVQ